MLFRGNRSAELYFASQPGWINPGITDQIANPVGAAVAFNELITSNKVLLETKVDKAVINRFIQLIIKHGPQDRLMKFFSSICVCVADNVIGNQETCLNQLIFKEQNREKILLEISTHDAGQVKPQLLNCGPKGVPTTYLGKEEVRRKL